MSIISPPAACIAAVDPVGVDIHIPLDQTLNENNSCSDIDDDDDVCGVVVDAPSRDDDDVGTVVIDDDDDDDDKSLLLLFLQKCNLNLETAAGDG